MIRNSTKIMESRKLKLARESLVSYQKRNIPRRVEKMWLEL